MEQEQAEQLAKAAIEAAMAKPASDSPQPPEAADAIVVPNGVADEVAPVFASNYALASSPPAADDQIFVEADLATGVYAINPDDFFDSGYD
ncbi:MAG: hypothetical protein ACN6OP_02945, partial [Pseudomonadales bacterium]